MDELKRIDPSVGLVWKAFKLGPEPAETLDSNDEYLRRVWHSPVYGTVHTSPENETGRPGVDLGSRNFNWGLPSGGDFRLHKVVVFRIS